VRLVGGRTWSALERLRARRRARTALSFGFTLASCVGIGPSFAGGRTLRATPVTEG